MSHVSFFFFCLTAGLTMSSCLRILNRTLNCSQPGLDNCKISTCLDQGMVVPFSDAPTKPELDNYELGIETDKHGLVPVMTVKWKLKSDASILVLNGSKINLLDTNTNQSMCVQFLFKVSQQLNTKSKKWTFLLDGVVVEPGHTYNVSVINLPETENGTITKPFPIPGCDDTRIQMAQVCLENGSMWDPKITTNVSVDKEHETFSIVVGFKTSQYSEIYQVSIQSLISKNVSRENRTSLNVTLELGLSHLSQGELSLTIQPFFVPCKNDCWSPKENICCYYPPPRTLIIKSTVGLLFIQGFLGYLLWRAFRKVHMNTTSSAAEEQPEGFQVQDRKRVFIIYSLDHPLYKNIVLKLCSFLVMKCGTEVVLDLLDSTRLGMLGSIQWLNWHKEQVENSSDKILILCSPGVQAKWKAMCGDKQVFLREDVRSPVGDMLTPALSLMVPHFIRSASFEKYIVAYFDGVCSEEDVPSPFNITVRYKLMKQFEELFFRILDIEKHQPGRVNHIKGILEDDYHQCSSGRALQDAIEAFQAYQLENPQWFEDELLEGADLEVEISDENSDNPKTITNLIRHCVPDSIQINLVETQESDFTVDKTEIYIEPLQTYSTVELNPLI